MADPFHLRPLSNAEILHEGPLSVRQNKGWVGLRRWLTRYYVICKSDWTLRRYKSIAEAERPTLAPRCLSLRDVDYIRADGASRFLIAHVDGSETKLSGEDSVDTRACGGACRLLARSVTPAHPRTHPPLSHTHAHCTCPATLQGSGCWPFRRRCGCWRRRRTCRRQRSRQTSCARSCRSSLSCGRRQRQPAAPAREGAWAAQAAPLPQHQQLRPRASTRRARQRRPLPLQRDRQPPLSPARPRCPLRWALATATS
jgi:hypothetical protein